MQAIKLDTRVGHDGILKLEIPVEVTDADVEVIVVINRKQKRGWPPGFFERTAGALADDPLERPPQGNYEERDPLL